jgi:hypothetical protein
MFLASPITWDHYFVLLAPTVLLVGPRLTQPDLLRGVFRLSLFVLWLNPDFVYALLRGPQWRPEHFSVLENLGVVSLGVYAITALFVVSAVVTRRAAAEGARSPAESEPRDQPALAGGAVA